MEYQHAVCDWCLTHVKAPTHYDPLQKAIYCSKHCLEKDWLFKRWMNDEWLTHVTNKYKGGDDETEVETN